jgi:hypothetical protein
MNKAKKSVQDSEEKFNNLDKKFSKERDSERKKGNHSNKKLKKSN